MEKEFEYYLEMAKSDAANIGKEIIESIKKSDYSYTIITNKQKIKIEISKHQECCESFGILSSDDNLNDFIGAELLNITKTNKELITYNFELNKDGDEAETIFVNFNTSKGKFQIAVYNSHNGYYGHAVKISSKQLKLTKTI